MTPPLHPLGVPSQGAETPTEIPFLDDRDLAALRHGPDRNDAYGRLHERCREHVLGGAPGQTLTTEACESIVAQAVVDEFPALLESKLDAAAVSRRLLASLGRARQRLLRERNDLEGTLSALATLGGNELSLSTPLQVARALDGFFGQALDSLAAEDRNLLIEEYRLGRFGFDERGPAPSIANLAGLASYRARKRFRRKLDRLLGDAIAKHDREASLLARLRDVVRNPAFFQVLTGSSRRPL